MNLDSFYGPNFSATGERIIIFNAFAGFLKVHQFGNLSQVDYQVETFAFENLVDVELSTELSRGLQTRFRNWHSVKRGGLFARRYLGTPNRFLHPISRHSRQTSQLDH